MMGFLTHATCIEFPGTYLLVRVIGFHRKYPFDFNSVNHVRVIICILCNVYVNVIIEGTFSIRFVHTVCYPVSTVPCAWCTHHNNDHTHSPTNESDSLRLKINRCIEIGKIESMWLIRTNTFRNLIDRTSSNKRQCHPPNRYILYRSARFAHFQPEQYTVYCVYIVNVR